MLRRPRYGNHSPTPGTASFAKLSSAEQEKKIVEMEEYMKGLQK